MTEGIIIKALSGFYYVKPDSGPVVACRARGKFRHDGVRPLVGDRVAFTPLADGCGALEKILPRRNAFTRPAVANIDQLIMIASGAVPVTDPFLIDRMTALAVRKGCTPVVCINKCDLSPAEDLWETYRRAGICTLRVSAQTGEGREELAETISGKVSAFTGNSGVGKSSILNMLQPGFCLQTGEVSDKLGRGRHTTRHVELFPLDVGGFVADTPGFSSFEEGELCPPQDLAEAFPEFLPYLGQCRFVGCSHRREQGCALLAALERGEVVKSRHESYVRLYEQALQHPSWAEKGKAPTP